MMQKQPQFHILLIQVLRYKFSRLVLSAVLLFVSSSFVAQEPSKYSGEGAIPEAVVIVESQTNVLLDTLSSRKVEFDQDPNLLIDFARDVALTHWDITRASRMILGPHWRRADAEERAGFEQEFLRTLLRYVVKAYGYYDDRLLEVIDYQWQPKRKGGWVLSKIEIPGGVNVAVDYRMSYSKKSKQWRLIDVRVEGISLISVKKSEFRQIASKSGIKALIEHMSDKNRTVLKQPSALEVATNNN